MTEWHADVGLLDRWVEGRAAMPEATSLEQHLLGCPVCRSLVQARVVAAGPGTVPDPESVWNRLRDEIEVPKTTAPERLFRRMGVAPNDARLVAQAPMFRIEWATSVLAVLVFAGVATQLGNSNGLWLFLAIAPLVPSTAVALCYDPRFDPALEQELTTPYSTVRLVLLRSIAVLAAVLPLLLVLGALLPGPRPYLWLLPAAGFVAAVLALSTVTTPLRAVAVIATVWFVTVSITARLGSPRDVLAAPVLDAYAAMMAIAIGAFATRTKHLRVPRQRGGQA